MCQVRKVKTLSRHKPLFPTATDNELNIICACHQVFSPAIDCNVFAFAKGHPLPRLLTSRSVITVRPSIIKDEFSTGKTCIICINSLMCVSRAWVLGLGVYRWHHHNPRRHPHRANPRRFGGNSESHNEFEEMILMIILATDRSSLIKRDSNYEYLLRGGG